MHLHKPRRLEGTLLKVSRNSRNTIWILLLAQRMFRFWPISMSPYPTPRRWGRFGPTSLGVARIDEHNGGDPNQHAISSLGSPKPASQDDRGLPSPTSGTCEVRGRPSLAET